eukprot:10529522-Ditylum_brightwellii.AAC.1
MVQSVIDVILVLVFQSPVQLLAHGSRVRVQSVTQSSIEENVQAAGGGEGVDTEAYSAGYFTVMSEVPCKICSSVEGSLPSDFCLD